MQLTFCLSSNVIFQHIVIIFYTSSVYLNASAVCMTAISTDTWKSYRFCTPVEDEKTLSILFFFFPKPDNSTQEGGLVWEILNALGFVC